MWKVWSLKGMNLEKANEKQIFFTFRIWTDYWALPISINYDDEMQRRDTSSVIITILCFSLKITFYKPV